MEDKKAMIAQATDPKHMARNLGQLQAARVEMTRRGYDILETGLSQAEIDYETTRGPWRADLLRLGNQMRTMSHVQALCLVGDWRKNTECRMLRSAAEMYGVEVIEL